MANERIRLGKEGSSLKDGNLKAKTAESRERYALTADKDKFFSRHNQRRKPAILGIEGLELEWPVSQHQRRKIDHLAAKEEDLLEQPSCRATRAENPAALACRWRVSMHEDEERITFQKTF